MERIEYERKKEEVADAIVARLEKVFPGLKEGTILRWVGGWCGGGVGYRLAWNGSAQGCRD